MLFRSRTHDQNCIFRILSDDFSYVFRRCCENVEFLVQDGDVFYRKVKKDSKNTFIQARTSRDKKAEILTHFQQRKRGKLFFSKLHFFDADRAELRHSNLVCGGLEDAIDCNARMLRSAFKTGFPLFFLYLLLLCATE